MYIRIFIISFFHMNHITSCHSIYPCLLLILSLLQSQCYFLIPSAVLSYPSEVNAIRKHICLVSTINKITSLSCNYPIFLLFFISLNLSKKWSMYIVLHFITSHLYFNFLQWDFCSKHFQRRGMTIWFPIQWTSMIPRSMDSLLSSIYAILQ